MQPNDWQRNNGQGTYTPEQLQQMQQQGMMPPQQMQPQNQQNVPLQQMTPEQMQQVQQLWYQNQQPAMPQQMTPEQVQQMQFEAMMQQAPPMPNTQPLPNVPQPQKKRRAPRPKRQKGQGGGGGIWKVLLVLAVAGGGLWFFLSNMSAPTQATAQIEMGVLGTTYTGDALIVRNEVAYSEEGVQSIDYIAQEGSIVYRGNEICRVYSTGYSTKEMTSLQDYRDQIKNYQRTLLKAETSTDQKMVRLENEVTERGLEVRSLVQGARGNLINQEIILETAITQLQDYFQSKYSSDMPLNRLFSDETTQLKRIESWIKPKWATEERVVSFYTDGFEVALTPSDFEQYTPSQVRAMINGEKPETTTAARGRTDLYRLVKQNNYAVLMLIKDNTWNPIEGTQYKLVLEQFSNTVVNAQVLSFTRSGGELLVRLAVIGDAMDVLYMRTCQAQLGDYADCMTVPVSALYMQNDTQGIVIIDGGQQLFVPINVLRQEGNTAYISAIQMGILTAGQTVRLFK